MAVRMFYENEVFQYAYRKKDFVSVREESERVIM